MKTPRSIELLVRSLDQLESSIAWLERSLSQCAPIGIKPKYSADDYDRYENLTSRYARVADLLVHKVLRSIDAVEFIEPGSLIDTANRAVARGFIDSVETLRNHKDLRNDIAHDYQTDDLSQLFAEVLKTAPEIRSLARAVLAYGRRLANER